ncbi:MAG: SAM-dependent chlorinase/fluorinase [Flavobacteriales bacterium]|nr:SAM-dependent chlorinase/fluorinase [Flavobacteriales bacterium]
MGILTLISDYGLTDHYVAVVKGAVLAQVPDVKIVDISHNVVRYNVREAGYLLRSSFNVFPKGTVHLIGVNEIESEKTPHRIVKFDGQYFIGADNGIFTELFDDLPEEVWDLTLPSNSTSISFPMLNRFVPAACFILNGGDLNEIAKPIEAFNEGERLRPIVDVDGIRGSIIHVDSYGNLITNVDRKLFDEVFQGKSFMIELRSKKKLVNKISEKFMEVISGEQLALFNNEGLLMIVVSFGSPEKGEGGGAQQLLGMSVGSAFSIIFK